MSLDDEVSYFLPIVYSSSSTASTITRAAVLLGAVRQRDTGASHQLELQGATGLRWPRKCKCGVAPASNLAKDQASLHDACIAYERHPAFPGGICSRKDKTFGCVALVPYATEHYSRLISDLAIIKVDPLVQAVMKGAPPLERIVSGIAIGFLQQSSRDFKVGHIQRNNKGPFYQIFD
jgi:hypothetical protein